IPAADVLPSSQILGRIGLLEEVVVAEPRERALVVHGDFGDDTWFVDVEVLERVVDDAVRRLVPVVMTARAAGASLRHLVGEQQLPAGDRRGLGAGRGLPQR